MASYSILLGYPKANNYNKCKAAPEEGSSYAPGMLFRIQLKIVRPTIEIQLALRERIYIQFIYTGEKFKIYQYTL